MADPAITDLNPTPTLQELAMQSSGDWIDYAVTITDADNDFDGGFLRITGFQAGDKVWVTGSGPLDRAPNDDILYNGVVIGTVRAGDIGNIDGEFRVTFNANATAAMIERVIENIWVYNESISAVVTRTWIIEVQDAAGNDNEGPAIWTRAIGAANPFDGLAITDATPAFGDVDGDGDLDMVVTSAVPGDIRFFENTGSATAGVWTERTGAANPFDALGLVGGRLTDPTFADVDHDGDNDLFVVDGDGSIRFFQHTGSVASVKYVESTGARNPFNGVSVAPGVIGGASATLVDLDGDGDRDLVLGRGDGGVLQYLANTGTDDAFAFAAPAIDLAGTDKGVGGAIAFGDVDGDGDYDLVVGDDGGAIRYFENTGSPATAAFAERTGGLNPFDGVQPLAYASLQFADIDGDGDRDLVAAGADGLWFIRNDTTHDGAVVATVLRDAFNPTTGADFMTGTGGDDTLDGGDGNDELVGGNGNDYLRGGAGDDILRGGAGSDTYVVDSLGDVIDASGNGAFESDIVISNISWTVGAGIGVLRLGLGHIDGTGNALGNYIFGGSGNNVLNGLGGDDELNGMTGHDTLNGGDGDDYMMGDAGNDTINGGEGIDYMDGGAGNDYLDGGAGFDYLIGGLGNDTYVLGEGTEDDPAILEIIELAGEGIDTIIVTTSHSLEGLEVENLTLNGGRGALTGNAYINVLTGHDLNDALYGLDANDTLRGGGGRDGLDGGSGVDTLDGGDGNDNLTGGLGADKMTGGAGADRFFLVSDAEAHGDRIQDLDFSEGDILDLGGINATAFVARFTKVAGQITLTYNAVSDVTFLRVDTDGNGAHDVQVVLVGDHTGSTGNLYTGPADTNGGWVL